MDLGQPSNLGSLISAVLVGLLALASNQYARMDRSTMTSFVEGIHLPGRGYEAPPEPVDEGKPTLKETEARIAKLESRLSTIFEQWKEGRIRADDRRLERMWKAIHQLKDRLDSNDDLAESLSTRARVNYVWIVFRAAEMNPEQFSDSFHAMSEDMSSEKDQTVRAQAAVLEIYHGYDPLEPDVGALNEKLKTFARENLDIGVFLYLIISRELCDVGNREAAETILRRGIQVYSTRHSHIGRIKLINELFDQQMGK